MPLTNNTLATPTCKAYPTVPLTFQLPTIRLKLTLSYLMNTLQCSMLLTGSSPRMTRSLRISTLGIMGSGLTRPLMGTHPTRASGLMALTAHQFPSMPAMPWTRISVTPLAPAHCLNRGMLNSPLLLRVIQLPGLIQMALVLCIQAMNSGLPYLAAMPSPPPMDEVRRLNNSTLPARGSPKHHLNLPPTPLSQHLWIDNLTTWISTQHMVLSMRHNLLAL